jgi:hypothetical protein
VDGRWFWQFVQQSQDRRRSDRDLHFNDLRGTAATKFYIAGFSMREIAETLAWEEESVEKIIRRYVGRSARRYMADTSYWLTFRSLEFPQILNPHLKKRTLHLVPQFHRGLEALVKELQERATMVADDHRFVLELSNLAVPTQRGRQ